LFLKRGIQKITNFKYSIPPWDAAFETVKLQCKIHRHATYLAWCFVKIAVQKISWPVLQNSVANQELH
jgi:hypothetical protein